MINFVKQLVDLYINKSRNGGRLSGSEFNNISKSEQINIITKNVEKVGFERWSYTADEISLLKRTISIPVSSGVFPKPSDLMFLMGLSYTTGGVNYDIDLLREDVFNYRVRSTIVMPELKDPIARWTNTAYEVLPATITSIKCTYIKIPADPVWAYTTPNAREIYDPANSVDFDLPISMAEELAMGILQKLGFKVRESQVIQFANQLKNNEQ